MTLLTLLLHRDHVLQNVCSFSYTVDDGSVYSPDSAFTYAPDSAFTYSPDSAFGYSVTDGATYEPCLEE